MSELSKFQTHDKEYNKLISPRYHHHHQADQMGRKESK